MRQSIVLMILVSFIMSGIMMMPISAMAESSMVDEITSNLKCLCGCTMIVRDCNCEEAAKIRGEVSAMVQQGASRKQIIKQLKSKYGNEILATPEKEGFDLSLWILPGIGVIIGGLLIYFIISKNRMSEDEIFEMEYQEFLEEHTRDKENKT